MKKDKSFDQLLRESVDARKEAKRSHFEDLPKQLDRCDHPEHNPPGFICIPQGKIYVHVCPGCGNETRVIPQQYSLGIYKGDRDGTMKLSDSHSMPYTDRARLSVRAA